MADKFCTLLTMCPQVHDDGREQLCGGDNIAGANLTYDQLTGIVNEEEGMKLPCMTLLQVEAKTLVSVVLALGTYLVAMTLRAAVSHLIL